MLTSKEASEPQCSLTGEHGDTGRGPSNSVLTFDLLLFRGFTVLLTAESPFVFWRKREGEEEKKSASAVGDSECMWRVNAAFSEAPSRGARLDPQCWQSRCVVCNCCVFLLAWTWQQRNLLLINMRTHEGSTVCSNNHNHVLPLRPCRWRWAWAGRRDSAGVCWRTWVTAVWAAACDRTHWGLAAGITAADTPLD